MAAEISWFDSDDTTPISSKHLGSVPPGEDYITKNGAPYQAVAKNTGDQDFTTVEVEIQQLSGYDLWEMVEIATGASAPAYPTGYVDKDTDPLALGALAVGASANVWIQIVMSLTTQAQQGKLANLYLAASV